MSRRSTSRSAGPLLAVLAVACLSRPAAALAPDRLVSQYSVGWWSHDDGLPLNTITTVLETYDGFIWLATQAGVVRFNGETFTVFNKGNAPALPSPLIHALAETSDHTLWIATANGVAAYRGGAFVVPAEASPLGGLDTTAFADDAPSGLWVGTHAGVWKLGQGGASPVAGWRDPVTVLARTRDGALWGGGATGLYRLRGHELSHFTTRDGLASDIVRTLSEGPDGTLWIGTDGGLDRWDGRQIAAAGLGDRISGAVGATLVDRDGSLWVATQGGALGRLRNGQLSVDASIGGLPPATIQSLFEDRERNLWAATSSGGLRRLRDTRFLAWGTPEGLACRHAWTLLEDTRHAVWVGCEEGLSRISRGIVTAFTRANGLSSDAVTSLYESPPGTLWIGTRGGLVELRDGVFTSFDRADGLADSGEIRGIGEDGGPGLVLATPKGLLRFVEGHGIPIESESLRSKKVVSFARALDGGLWMGTLGQGLVHMKGTDVTVYDRDAGLADAKVLSAYEDERHVVWIATFGGGLNRLESGHARAVTSDNGLADDALLAALPDDMGGLWLSSNSGISRVSTRDVDRVIHGGAKDLLSRSFGRDDGMRSSECNGGYSAPAIRASTGHLWFATDAGVVEIDPGNLSPNLVAPPVVIDSVVWGTTTTLDPRTLDLSPGGDNLDIHFAPLTYVSPKTARARYKLDGFDQTWIDVGSRRTARYTHLPPGKYNFEVTAANDDGVWSERLATLPITVEPRYFQTLWFRGLALLATFGAALFGVRSWTARQRAGEIARRDAAARRELEQALDMARGEIAEREQAQKESQDLRDQLVQSQKMEAIGTLAGGIAHDMNNVLAGIMGLATVLSEELPEGSSHREDAITILNASNRGADLTRNLLAFSRKGKYREEEIVLRIVLADVARLIDRTLRKGTAVRVHEVHGDERLDGDPGLLTHALLNVCLNASDAMGRTGTIDITTQSITVDAATAGRLQLIAGRYVVVRVIDTGTGMSPETRKKAFEPFFTTKAVGEGTGLGLSMVYGTMKSHGGAVEAESEPGKGTTVSLYLPVRGTRSPVPDVARPARSLGKGKVMVIDDETMVLASAGRILTRLGYKVILAAGAAEALEVFARDRASIDAVILDMTMPGMAGPSCFDALQALQPNTKVVLCSGYAAGNDVERLLARGAVAFLEKPYTSAALGEVLERVLRGGAGVVP